MYSFAAIFMLSEAKAHCGQPVYPYTDLTLISLKINILHIESGHFTCKCIDLVYCIFLYIFFLFGEPSFRFPIRYIDKEERGGPACS